MAQYVMIKIIYIYIYIYIYRERERASCDLKQGLTDIMLPHNMLVYIMPLQVRKVVNSKKYNFDKQA